MKKFLTGLCAALAFAFAFTACSNDSSDSEYWYNIDMGSISKTKFDTLGIDQSKTNTSNEANFAIYQKLRGSSSGSMSIKESQLSGTFSAAGIPDSMIDGEVAKLKNLRNYLMIVDDGTNMNWRYAESAGNAKQPIR